MFKAYFLFEPGNDPFQFRGDDAAEKVRAGFPGVMAYVQTRALPGQASPAFSGSAELWFANADDALAACRAGPGGLAVGAASVQSVLAGMERQVMKTPTWFEGGHIKGVYPFCRKPDMQVDAFQHYWWHNHGPIAALTEEALAYVQIHPVPAHYDLPSAHYDGITEITWSDAEAAGRALVSRQMTEDQGGDAPHFVKMDSVALFLAEEEAVIAPC